MSTGATDWAPDVSAQRLRSAGAVGRPWLALYVFISAARTSARTGSFAAGFHPLMLSSERMSRSSRSAWVRHSSISAAAGDWSAAGRRVPAASGRAIILLVNGVRSLCQATAMVSHLTRSTLAQVGDVFEQRDAFPARAPPPPPRNGVAPSR